MIVALEPVPIRMARRKRKHIAMIEIAAAFAACELERNGELLLLRALEAHRAPAKEVLRLFTPDHIRLHCWGGEDKWWNLHMKRRDTALKIKDRADTARAAKVVRLDLKWGAFMRAVSEGRKPRPRRSRWPKRKVGS